MHYLFLHKLFFMLTRSDLAAIRELITPQFPNVSFFSFAEKIINQAINNGRTKTAAGYATAVNHLRRFARGSRLKFEDFTAPYLAAFKDYLLARSSPDNAAAVLVNLRTIYNRFANYYDIDRQPFKRLKIKRQSKNQGGNRALSAQQIKKIFDYVPSNVFTEMARDIFELSFNLCGINVCDLYELRASALRHNSITYQRKKTRDRRADRAEITIKLTYRAAFLFNKYFDPFCRRALNFYNRYSTAEGFLKMINKHLKIIGDAVGVPNLTSYFARHSWASIAFNDCNINIEDITQALNHVNRDHLTDFVYIKKNFSRVDAANLLVFKRVYEQ